MRRTAKIVAEWARKIPKRAKPWASSQLAVQQKQVQEQLALNLTWFSKPVHQEIQQGINDQLEFVWNDNQSLQRSRDMPPWVMAP